MNPLFPHCSEKLFRVLTSLILSLTLLVMIVTSSVMADEGRLSLSALIEELETQSPDIKAARERWEATRAVVPQVQTLPDPRLQIGYQRMPMVPPVVEGAMYGVGQEIPFPGKLKLKGKWLNVTLNG